MTRENLHLLPKLSPWQKGARALSASPLGANPVGEAQPRGLITAKGPASEHHHIVGDDVTYTFLTGTQHSVCSEGTSELGYVHAGEY